MKEVRSISETKLFKILLVKAYFDKGWALTNYFKYLFAFAGIFSFINKTQAIYIGVGYIVVCVIVGLVWFKFNFVEIENEIQNRYNPFQQQIRKALKVKA